MQLENAERKRAKIKLGLQGPSGSGKTFSALLLAFGLCYDWSKIAVIDSENGSSHLYAHLGNYKVLKISAPFTPESYIQAIKICEQASMEVIIVDSISHEWEGIGGILEIHSNLVGNSYTNWNKISPRHNSFIQHILQSPAHIIGTIRSKQDYVLSEKNGKVVPEKVGLKGVTREGMDYEMTLVLELDIKHNASATKDRTGLFMDKPEFKITSEVGQAILEWCEKPLENNEQLITELIMQIDACKTSDQLLDLYRSNAQIKDVLLPYLTKKRRSLEVASDLKQIVQPKNISSNGTIASK